MELPLNQSKETMILRKVSCPGQKETSTDLWTAENRRVFVTSPAVASGKHTKKLLKMAIEIVDLPWFTQLLAMVDLSIVFLYVYQRVIQQTTGGGIPGWQQINSLDTMFYSSPGFRCQAMQVAQWLRLSGADSGPAKLQWCIRYYVYISYNICIVYIYILVGGFNHLENIWVGQWEEWHPIYHGKFQTCLKPPTSILIVGPSRLLNNNQYLWRQVPVYIYGGNTQSPYMFLYWLPIYDRQYS